MSREGEHVQAYLRGHREAGAALVDRYYGRILAFFRNKAPAAAHDLTQEVFVECFAALGRLRDPERFRSFLFAVACNQLRKHYARCRRDGDHLDFGTVSAIDLDPSPSRIVAGKEEQRLVLEGLRRLPVDYQVVLELVFWEDMTAAEIGEVLDVPLGTVKTRIRRGKALLGESVAALAAGAGGLALVDVDAWARGLRERAGAREP